ncbi:hypothetical protein AEA09_03270 [Lysinibacillus contaminans]|uniref:Uncharacterized protein n=1 Tax=Lysinibacillus contaminans TaxID=1293441 RepID=A0ABR5JYT4_9BACI|nr:hypothetical protein AEA09_03270 [Lysinibacillus contaminans]
MIAMSKCMIETCWCMIDVLSCCIRSIGSDLTSEKESDFVHGGNFVIIEILNCRKIRGVNI